MSILIEQDQDMAALRRGTRLFLLAGLLATLAIVMAILVRQGLFRQTTALSFVAESAQDIGIGQAVKIAGFRVGSVESVLLRADGKVQVQMEIEADRMQFVTRDAVVQLHKEGLIGSAVLEIIPGHDKSRLATAEAQLAFVRSEGLGAMANSLRDKIFPLLGDIKTLTGMLTDPEQGLPPLLARMRETSASLNALLQTGTSQVSQVGQASGRVLGKVEGVVTETGRVLGKVESAVTETGRVLQTVSGQIPPLLDKTQRIVEHVEKITADAETSVPPVLRDGAAVAADVREIVTGAKTAWPIRHLVQTPAPARLKADSDPRAESARGAP